MEVRHPISKSPHHVIRFLGAPAATASDTHQGDLGGRKSPIVDVDFIHQAVEVVGCAVVGEADVDSLLPVEVRHILVSRDGQETIDVDLLAPFVAAVDQDAQGSAQRKVVEKKQPDTGDHQHQKIPVLPPGGFTEHSGRQYGHVCRCRVLQYNGIGCTGKFGGHHKADAECSHAGGCDQRIEAPGDLHFSPAQ